MKSLNAAEFGWSELLDEQRRLWHAGDVRSVEELLAGSPWEHDSDARLDLIYNEIVIREELGDEVSAAEYLARYPQFAADLELQLEIHRVVGNPDFLGANTVAETADLHADDSWPEPRQSSPKASPAPADYELLRELGRGGNGVVYLARHRRLRREVALKMFRHGRLPSSRERLRFQAEAEACARLTHPNIVQIFEIGEQNGSPYLALEPAEGGTLAQKLELFPLTPPAAAELIETLARAVQHAHDRNVLHRDLKPANILFARDGTPKIADFGLAKIEHDDDAERDITRTGEPLGTPRYMAPEQTGCGGSIGPTTDVYALGTLLYECLTGRPPFVAACVVETIQKIRADDPLPPRRLQPRLPRDLETICLHCLRKEPSRRYPSARELAADLRRYLDGKPIHARPTPAWERAWKWCRRRPTEAGLIAAGFLALVAATGAAATNSHLEQVRIAQLRKEVAELMAAGRQALSADDFTAAETRFFDAWRLVQGEPALHDHVPGVSGWLDHCRRAADVQLWQARLPPREFDERRDEAIVESSLPDPRTAESVSQALEAVEAARALTLPRDPAWDRERELLALLAADLLADERGDLDALNHLDLAGEFRSSLFHQRRAELLRRLDQISEAEAAQAKSAEFPPEKSRAALLAGVSAFRKLEYAAALADCEEVLAAEPAHFTARLLQAQCLLQLDRPAEARIALTACIAQRPTFPWSYLLRGRAHQALNRTADAESDLRRAAAFKPSPMLRSALNHKPATELQSPSLSTSNP